MPKNFKLAPRKVAVRIGDTDVIWYKVVAGAFSDSAQAERLLASLRRRRIVSASDGTVLHVPFALRVDSVPAQAAASSKASEKIHGYAARGLAVYALAQADGHVGAELGRKCRHVDRPGQRRFGPQDGP